MTSNQPYPPSSPDPRYGVPPLDQIPPGRPYPQQGQVPPPAARPAREYFRRERPGDAGGHFVLPMNLIDAMPPAWQQGFITMLEQYYQQHRAVRWPDRYRVTATKSVPVSDCNDTQLAEVGIAADFSDAGELVYRDSNDEVITDPASRRILVAVPDPAQQ